MLTAWLGAWIVAATEGFMPHGHCFHWQPELLWAYVLSDGVIGLSYYSIPIALWTFARRRADLPFSWIFVLFALFIAACGTTHLIGILTIWQADYWIDALMKIITAALSLTTAIIIWPLMPKALALPSAAHLTGLNLQLEEVNARLEATNVRLMREAAARREIEKNLQLINRAAAQILYTAADRTAASRSYEKTSAEDLALTRAAAKVLTLAADSVAYLSNVDTTAREEL